MSETEVQRAFGKLADRYEEISREVFGDRPLAYLGPPADRTGEGISAGS